MSLRNIFSIGSLILLTACMGVNGYRGIPKLADGSLESWHYACDSGGVNVQYGNVGGQYGARLLVEKQERLLFQTDSQYVFTLDRWRWISVDGIHFSLFDEDKALLTSCVAREIAPKNGIALHPQFSL